MIPRRTHIWYYSFFRAAIYHLAIPIPIKMIKSIGIVLNCMFSTS